MLGRHNARLIRLVIAVLQTAGIDIDVSDAKFVGALQSFEPLPHRLQPVREVNNVLFVNDSLATTPIATIAAVEAFEGRPLTVLVGGYDRGVSFDAFGQFIRNRNSVKLIALPDSGERIAKAVGKPELVTAAGDLREAVQIAARTTPAGGVVLLSPGAASLAISSTTPIEAASSPNSSRNCKSRNCEEASPKARDCPGELWPIPSKLCSTMTHMQPYDCHQARISKM